MQRFLIILPIVLICSGCAKIAHLPQLLTLKSYSDEKGKQKAFVKAQDKKFEMLIKAVEDSSISRYSDKVKVVQAFGKPIFIQAITLDGKSMEQWMYRYAAEYFDSKKKVYLYFEQEDLKRWEIVNPGEIPQIVSTGGKDE